jgi:hypothetical protein
MFSRSMRLYGMNQKRQKYVLSTQMQVSKKPLLIIILQAKTKNIVMMGIIF